MALKRLPTTLLGVIGSLVAGFAGASELISGVAWAALAGLALSLMLHGFGLRVLGALIALLGVGGAAVSFSSQLWMVLPFGLVLASGILMMIAGPGWLRNRAPKQPTDDWWQRMDAGDDPTD